MIIKGPNYFENIYGLLSRFKCICSLQSCRQINMFRAEDSDCLVFDYIFTTHKLFDFMRTLFYVLDKDSSMFFVQERTSMFLNRRSNMKSKSYTILENLQSSRTFLVYPVYGNKVFHNSSNMYKYIGKESYLYFSKYIPPYIIEVEDDSSCGCRVYIRYNIGADLMYREVYETFIEKGV